MTPENENNCRTLEIQESLGIIAGSRSLPLALARLARSSGVPRIVAVGFLGETDPALTELVDELIWLRVGQLVKLIEAFTKRGVRRCVMAGQIAPKNLFELRPDWRALSLLLKLKERNARTIFGSIANELQKDGITLLDARPWLRPMMPSDGFLIGPKLSTKQKRDVAFGWGIAKEVSRLEIGQTVVVRNGTVLAVEGFEGTDECLRRGGGLAGKSGGATAVKVASIHHDFRFDIPCIGPNTIKICASAGIAVVAIESDKTLLLEREQVESLASEHKIALVTSR